MTKYHYRIPSRVMDTIGRRPVRDIEIQYADMTPAQQQIADASQDLRGKVMPMGLSKQQKIAWMRENIGVKRD
jgi:hypothetical protein